MENTENQLTHPTNNIIIDASYEGLGSIIDQCKGTHLPKEMTSNTEQTTPTTYASALQGKQVSVRLDWLESLTHPTTNQLNPKEKSTAQRRSRFDRELKSLQSYNKHGISESLISETLSRHRKPSLENAKIVFQEALVTIE